MRLLRTAAAVLGASAVLLAATPANAVTTVQGESASSYTSTCGDGGDPAMGPRFSGSTNTMFFPSGDCSATYSTHVGTVTSARFHLSGVSGTQCGTITISGSNSSSAYVCVTNDTWTTASFNTTTTASYTVSWDPDNYIVNLWLDHTTVVGV